MHILLQNARRAAGISGLRKNYPDDPKQRSAGHWAAFIGSLNNDLGQRDEVERKYREKVAADLQAAHQRIEALEARLREAMAASVTKGVEVPRHQEGWSIEKANEVQKTIAG